MSSGPSPEYRAFVEAGIGILMAVIVADGKYTQEEFSWFKNVQHRHPLFRDVPADAFNPMLRSVKAQLAAGAWKPLVEKWAAAIPRSTASPCSNSRWSCSSSTRRSRARSRR